MSEQALDAPGASGRTTDDDVAVEAAAVGTPATASTERNAPRLTARGTGDGRRLRVVFCVDSFIIGGTELNAVRTAERLDQSRFDLRVACLSAEGPLRRRYEEAGIPVVDFPISSLYGRDMLRQGVRLARYLRAEGVDVVHNHDIYSNIFGTAWARVAGTPVILASRRWWHSLNQPAHRVGNRVAYRVAHYVLANSPAVAASLTDDDGVPASRIVTVPNFVDEAAFAPMAAGERAARRAAFGVPADATVVGVVARLSPVKDHASLLRAAAELRRRWPSMHILLVGDGETRPALEAQARELGITHVVHFAGTQSNHVNLHALFDVSALCSLSEGFPNSLVEAMAAGRPVVATAVGGNADAVEDGVTGVLVPPADPARLAAALEGLLADPARRAAMGEAARTRARERYHASSVVRQLEEGYVRMLERRAPRRALEVAR
ncbi:MAG: glycosyltransferase [Gemmatimonadaceae bacterium]